MSAVEEYRKERLRRGPDVDGLTADAAVAELERHEETRKEVHQQDIAANQRLADAIEKYKKLWTEAVAGYSRRGKTMAREKAQADTIIATLRDMEIDATERAEKAEAEARRRTREVEGCAKVQAELRAEVAELKGPLTDDDAGTWWAAWKVSQAELATTRKMLRVAAWQALAPIYSRETERKRERAIDRRIADLRARCEAETGGES